MSGAKARWKDIGGLPGRNVAHAIYVTHGTYSSALLREPAPMPPATSTVPSGSSVAVWS
ncbi:hypothetical protein BDSB_28150 [Burkholderia dolosa PC543]|nr:hypothetical protein BDSB_28150 [Burkholderia dolosa PC543]